MGADERSISEEQQRKFRNLKVLVLWLQIADQSGEKSIECTNRRGTCRRNICECDKRLAEQLGKYESEWNESLHKNRGGFVREENCFKANGGNNPIEECCGNEFTFPLNKPRRANQCCSGAEVKDIG